jgi:predicted heme/steroid binding protein
MSDANTTRRRKPAETPKKDDEDQQQDKPSQSTQETSSSSDRTSPWFSLLDILRILVGLSLLSVCLSYFITGSSLLWGWNPWFLSPAQVQSYLRGPIFLTDEQLLAYNGVDPKKPILLGLNGSIYDVSAAPKTYGPGGGYHFFAGRDAARAYLTGCFQEDLTPDLRGVEEMFIPIDPPEDPTDDGDVEDGKEPKGKEGRKGVTKTELKIRRERDYRMAKKKVQEGIEGWAKVFSGETGRPYFWVGTIKREEGWLEKLPRRELCKPAMEGRPKRGDEQWSQPYTRQ